MTRRRSSKIRRKRALSSPASRSAARAAHWTNSFVEMKKLPCIAVSAGMKARGAIRYPTRQPVIAKALENPLSTKAWSVNSSTLCSGPS